METKVKIIICVVVIAILLVGIFAGVKAIKDGNELNTQGENSNVEKITYTIDKDTSGESKYAERGAYSNVNNGTGSSWQYTVAMGEQSTGGYYITIENVYIDNSNNVEIIVKESTGSGLANDVMTYPICGITFNKRPTSIIVKNTDGARFENINF